jgi:hypothetical protein
MLAQLRKLLEMSRLPNVSIRVVPFDAGVVPAGVNKFIILRFVKFDIADVVLLENLTDHRHLGTSNGKHSGPRLTAAAGDRRLRFGGGCGVDVVAVRGFGNDRGLCPMRRKSLPWIRVMR